MASYELTKAMRAMYTATSATAVDTRPPAERFQFLERFERFSIDIVGPLAAGNFGAVFVVVAEEWTREDELLEDDDILEIIEEAEDEKTHRVASSVPPPKQAAKTGTRKPADDMWADCDKRLLVAKTGADMAREALNSDMDVSFLEIVGYAWEDDVVYGVPYLLYKPAFGVVSAEEFLHNLQADAAKLKALGLQHCDIHVGNVAVNGHLVDRGLVTPIGGHLDVIHRDCAPPGFDGTVTEHLDAFGIQRVIGLCSSTRDDCVCTICMRGGTHETVIDSSLWFQRIIRDKLGLYRKFCAMVRMYGRARYGTVTDVQRALHWVYASDVQLSMTRINDEYEDAETKEFLVRQKYRAAPQFQRLKQDFRYQFTTMGLLDLENATFEDKGYLFDGSFKRMQRFPVDQYLERKSSNSVLPYAPSAGPARLFPYFLPDVDLVTKVKGTSFPYVVYGGPPPEQKELPVTATAADETPNIPGEPESKQSADNKTELGPSTKYREVSASSSASDTAKDDPYGGYRKIPAASITASASAGQQPVHEFFIFSHWDWNDMVEAGKDVSFIWSKRLTSDVPLILWLPFDVTETTIALDDRTYSRQSHCNKWERTTMIPASLAEVGLRLVEETEEPTTAAAEWERGYIRQFKRIQQLEHDVLQENLARAKRRYKRTEQNVLANTSDWQSSCFHGVLSCCWCFCVLFCCQDKDLQVLAETMEREKREVVRKEALASIRPQDVPVDSVKHPSDSLKYRSQYIATELVWDAQLLNTTFNPPEAKEYLAKIVRVPIPSVSARLEEVMGFNRDGVLDIICCALLEEPLELQKAADPLVSALRLYEQLAETPDPLMLTHTDRDNPWRRPEPSTCCC